MSDDRFKPAQQVEAERQADALEKYRAAELEIVRRDTDMFYQELVVKPAQEVAKLPENVFVNVFLPYFRGDKKFSEHPNLLGNWYAIAGSIGSEVAIIDGKGQELYRVPPYVNTRGIDPTHNSKRQDMSFYDIDGISEGLARARPMEAMRFRAEKWDDKMDALTAGAPDPASILGRWAEIFKRYDTLTQAGATAPSASTPIKKNTEDDLEF